MLIFRATIAGGSAAGITDATWQRRAVIAAAALFILAVVDVYAMAKSRYCPIGWRRQTPRPLLRRRGPLVAALVWGFDTGLLVTTFRVAAISWGALVMTFLGLAPGWSGVAYGVGFALPFLLLIARPRIGRASRGETAEDPGFEAMLARRPALQGASAVLLTASGALLAMMAVG